MANKLKLFVLDIKRKTELTDARTEMDAFKGVKINSNVPRGFTSGHFSPFTFNFGH
jgi:hypothetical protein